MYGFGALRLQRRVPRHRNRMVAKASVSVGYGKMSPKYPSDEEHGFHITWWIPADLLQSVHPMFKVVAAAVEEGTV